MSEAFGSLMPRWDGYHEYKISWIARKPNQARMASPSQLSDNYPKDASGVPSAEDAIAEDVHTVGPKKSSK